MKEWFKNGRVAGKNIAKMFSIIWRLDKPCMFLLLIETIFYSISVFPEMFLLKASADALTSGRPFEEYTVVVTIWIGISLLRNLGWNYINTISPAKQSRMIQKMQNEYSKKCLELDYDMLAKPAILDVKNVAQQAIYGGMGDSTWEFLTMISNAIVLFASLGIVLTVDAWSVLLTAVLVFVSPFMHASLWKKQYNIAVEKETTVRRHDYFHSTFSDFANLKEVRIYNMAERIAKKIGVLITELIQSEKKAQNVSFAVTSTTIVISVLLNAGIYTLLGVKLLYGTITMGEFLLAFSALSAFKDKLSGIAGWFSSYIRASHFIEKYFEFLALDGNFNKGDMKITDIDLSRNPTVKFEDVSFKYPGQDIYALKNVNAEITLGAKVSVVGENGAGKTTFVKLLCRLYDPTEGRILLGGTDIRNLKYVVLMSLFSCVFLDF
jgi:ABC-type multidrug transport system fused ATPase/permease subunit